VGAHRTRRSTEASFRGRGATAVRADTEPSAVRFDGGGPVEHEEASGSSYVAEVGWRVAVDCEPLADGEAACDELAPRALADGLSLDRCYAQRMSRGVLLPGFDGDRRVRQWSAMVVLSVRRRVKQSGGGLGAWEKEKWRRVSSAAPRSND
jgi:hypothetical protein